MALGLLGRKKGMTQIFGKAGEVIPVTVIEAGPCTVVERKSRQRDGYDALLLGFEKAKKIKRLSRAMQGFFGKRKLDAHCHLREFRLEAPEALAVGSTLRVDLFQPGEHVDVAGITKGRGFQGVIKRHGEHGGPDSHGAKRFHRRPGSIGQNSWPSRVYKKVRMPGRMGSNRVQTKNLKIVEVVLDQNLLLVKGAVPGSRGGMVIVYHRGKDLEDRLQKRTTDQGPGTRDQKEEASGPQSTVHGPQSTVQKHGDTKENRKDEAGAKSAEAKSA